MATFARVSPTGWQQGDDAAPFSRTSLDGWEHFGIAGSPAAPTGVTAGSVTALSATASWTDASSDETGFKVEYAPSPYTSWTALSGSPTAANATSLATGNVLTDGTSYKFRVASTNANGDSAYVESGVFVAQNAPPPATRPVLLHHYRQQGLM
jgi:uncharacterized Zn-binding protein involved in type VI secretion